MTDLKKIPSYILNDARQNCAMGEEPFTDEELSRKSKRQIFKHYMQWQGIIGYDEQILAVVESLFDVELQQIILQFHLTEKGDLKPVGFWMPCVVRSGANYKGGYYELEKYVRENGIYSYQRLYL